MSFSLLDLLHRLPMSRLGPASGIILAILALISLGFWMGWWASLKQHLGWGFWLGGGLLLGLAALVGGVWLFRRYREQHFVDWMRQKNNREHEQEQEQSYRVQEKLRQAMRKIQEAPESNDKEGDPLNVPPKYLLLGARSSGKTALLQSVRRDLPPTASLSDIHEGPTADFNWLVPDNKCFLIDTSGSYAFPEQVEQQGIAWYCLLQELYRYNRRQPINGLIITLSAYTLATREKQELADDARVLRDRIEEAIRVLKVQFPIYLLITRGDLLDGFTEFFDCFPGRTQEVFGYVYVPESTKGHYAIRTTVADFQKSFAELVGRLRQLRLSILNQDKPLAPSLRHKIFCFPEEFQALQDPLSYFIEALLYVTRNRYTPFFRGIFLCSARQEGTPVSSLRRAFAIVDENHKADNDAKSSKAYFLRDLFTVILPRDQHLVWPARRLKRRRTGIREGSR